MNTTEETEIKNVDSQPTTSQALKDGLITEKLADGSHSVSLIRRTAGPRTRQGKERSKHNALKHGVFSKQVVLPDESDAEFHALLDGLRNDFQPEGTLEDVLVEKLAALFWRNRRLIIAESAEIQKGVKFLAWDEKQRQQETAHCTSRIMIHIGGIVRGISNPILLQRSLDLLEKLRRNLGENGFDPEKDMGILIQLYGSDSDRWTETLLDFYSLLSDVAGLPEDVRQQKGLSSPEEYKKFVLARICDEVERLNRYKRARARIESNRMKLEALSRNVPDAPQLDRLLRYETAISREIDRTLNQLERLQRMRLGQLVPPPINLNVTTSKE
jgi:hypothetical protein